MKYDKEKNIELYLLKAGKFNEDIAPNQKKYYLDVVQWMRENDFDSAEEVVEAMKHTRFYEGGTIAKTADDIELRIKAMKTVGYDDVAKIHEMRRGKFNDKGNSYAFSQEWLEDYELVASETEKYARKKEIFGKIFRGYFQIAGNPQSNHREEAVKDIATGLEELAVLGTSLEELAKEEAYRKLVMTTDRGMDNFIAFINDFKNGTIQENELSDIRDEQEELAIWVKNNKEKLKEVGRNERWAYGCAIAVPSDAPGGYDYISIKEVE